VSDAATALHHPAVEPAESPLTPESWGKLGMWIFLAGDAVGFGVLLASYGAMRVGSVDWPNPAHVLGIQLTALMTFLLICSSVTMVKALEALQASNLPRAKMFLLLTAAGGAIFVGLAIVTDSLYALLTSSLANRLKGSQRFHTGGRYFAGLVYVGLGITTALTGTKK